MQGPSPFISLLLPPPPFQSGVSSLIHVKNSCYLDSVSFRRSYGRFFFFSSEQSIVSENRNYKRESDAEDEVQFISRVGCCHLCESSTV